VARTGSCLFLRSLTRFLIISLRALSAAMGASCADLLVPGESGVRSALLRLW